jgi:peptidoglycan/xylan/chitin deacetylase (PgdA/CDA1 family)
LAHRAACDRLRLRAANALTLILQRSARRAGIVLVYHRVGDPHSDPDFELDPVLETALFEQQLDLLAQRYQLVPAAEVLPHAAQRRRGDAFPVAITFDDDLVSHTSVVAPILRRRAVAATFFLSGSNRRGWWHDLEHAVATHGLAPDDLPGVEPALVSAALARRPRAIHRLAVAIEALPPARRDDAHQRLLASVPAGDCESAVDSDGIRVLVASGGRIGFHTLGHYDLRTMDDVALSRELTAGRGALETVAGSAIDAVAYPHGKSDVRVAAAAAAAGFRFGFTTEGTAVTPEADPLRIPRVEAEPRSLGRFSLLLARILRSSG